MYRTDLHILKNAWPVCILRRPAAAAQNQSFEPMTALELITQRCRGGCG